MDDVGREELEITSDLGTNRRAEMEGNVPRAVEIEQRPDVTYAATSFASISFSPASMHASRSRSMATSFGTPA